MKNCSRCGNTLKPNKKFCTVCGLPVPPDVKYPAAPRPTVAPPDLKKPAPQRPSFQQSREQVQPQPNLPQAFCIHCGSPLKPDAKFCTRCGQLCLNLPPVQSPGVQSVAPPQQRWGFDHQHLDSSRMPGGFADRNRGAFAIPPAATRLPKEDLMIALPGRALRREGFALRFVAALIDGVILALLIVTLTLILNLVWLPILLTSGYYFLEVLLGYTPGKRLLNLMVLSQDTQVDEPPNPYDPRLSPPSPHDNQLKVSFDALSQRWRLKVGIICAFNFLILVAGQFNAPEPVKWLLQLPSLVVVIASLTIFGVAKQTFYDKMSKTAVFKVDFQKGRQGSSDIAETSRKTGNILRTLVTSFVQFFKTSSGIFDRNGKFSLQGLLLFPFRILKARFKAFLIGFLIGTIIHFIAVSLNGGFQDVAGFPTSLLLPTRSSLFFPIASALWMTVAMLLAFFRASRNPNRSQQQRSALGFFLFWAFNIGWYFLTIRYGLADDGGLSEFATNPTDFVNQGGVDLLGQSGGLGGVPTGIGNAIGGGIPTYPPEPPPGDGSSLSGGSPVSSPTASSWGVDAASSSNPGVSASASPEPASPMGPSLSSDGVSSSTSPSSGSPSSSGSQESSLSSSLSSLSSASSLSSLSSTLSSADSSASSSIASQSSVSSSSDASLSSSSDTSSSATDSSDSSAIDSSSSSEELRIEITSFIVTPSLVHSGHEDPVWGPTNFYSFDIQLTFINNTHENVLIHGTSYTGGNGSDSEMIETNWPFGQTVTPHWSYYLGNNQPVVFTYYISGPNGLRSNTVRWAWKTGSALPITPTSPSPGPSAEPSLSSSPSALGSSSMDSSGSSSEESSSSMISSLGSSSDSSVSSSDSSSSQSSSSDSSSSSSSSSDSSSSSSESSSSSSESSSSSSESSSSSSPSQSSSSSSSESSSSSSESSSPSSSSSSQSSSASSTSSSSLGSPSALARGLIDKSGTADDADVNEVARELDKLPRHILDELQRRGIRIKVCRGSVTEIHPELRGVQPRGWPAGSTWDTVPGAAFGNDLVIATRGHGTPAGGHIPTTGDGHGSYNLVIHETMHLVDHGGAGGDRSGSAGFTTARTADSANLSAYESQAGAAGQEESYAESAARFYGGDPSLHGSQPNLEQYWQGDPTRPRP